MSLFSGLSEKLNHVFKKLTNKGKLTELEIKEAMREIKIALLEADVNYLVVKDFIAKTSQKCVNDETGSMMIALQRSISFIIFKVVQIYDLITRGPLTGCI